MNELQQLLIEACLHVVTAENVISRVGLFEVECQKAGQILYWWNKVMKLVRREQEMCQPN
jgi:hypothetical protein